MLIESYDLEINISTHSDEHFEYEAIVRLGVDISQALLPRTSCKACGEQTCFNFALKLVADQAELSQCAPLIEKESLDAHRVQLESHLATRWPALKRIAHGRG